MKVKNAPFGKFEGQNIQLFTLKNDQGMAVSLMNYGATITSILVPGDDGKQVSLAAGFDRFEDYLGEEYVANAPYFGCTVGRYCSQIKDSRFELNGTEYKLAVNCGDNNLHGGVRGFDKQVWEAKPYEKVDEAGVEFSRVSADMEEGFPGEVKAKVRISLNEENEIHIRYEAVPDKDTPLSMTNHTYFNLGGFKSDILGHLVKVNSQRKLEMDETGAATGTVVELDGSVDDLSSGKKVGEVQEAMGGGFEHFFVFEATGKLHPMAEIADPDSGRVLEVESTEPCMLFYSGTYTSDKLQRNAGEQYGQFRAFCCETHRWQNGPNIPASPGTITRAGEEFRSHTVFRIS